MLYPGAKPRRVDAFDTPYLGMHPRVLTSLLPKGNEPGKEKQSDAINYHNQVEIFDDKVTDDWEGYKELHCAFLDSRFVV